jgi:chemotaxis protein CheD
VAAGDAKHVFKTLLGSCVSITLWHPGRKIGAISHFLLPNRGSLMSAGLDGLDGRYADEAMPLMFRELTRLGVDPAKCHAKVFGGARMFFAETLSGARGVGRRNGDIARDLLYARGLKIVAEDLFGVGHRQLVFDVSNGDVWSRQVQPGDPEWQGTR